jgi:hypothetical protein
MKSVLRIPNVAFDSFHSWLVGLPVPGGWKQPTIGDVKSGRFFRYDLEGSEGFFEELQPPAGWSRDDPRLLAIKVRDRCLGCLDVVVECHDPALGFARRRFETLVESVCSQWPAAELLLDGTDILIPKTSRALDRWRRLYRHLLNLRADMRDEWEDERTKTATVTLDEWRDRLISEDEKPPSKKTLSKIERAGDAGFLI